MQCGYGEKLYERFFFLIMRQKLELLKQIRLFKKGFVIFSKGLRFRSVLTILRTLRFPNPLSAILGDFLSISFKPHREVACTVENDRNATY